MNPIQQQFFNDLEKKLWTAADKLRFNLDAAVLQACGAEPDLHSKLLSGCLSMIGITSEVSA